MAFSHLRSKFAHVQVILRSIVANASAEPILKATRVIGIRPSSFLLMFGFILSLNIFVLSLHIIVHFLRAAALLEDP